MRNRLYFFHNFLWIVLSPLGLFINLLMFELNVSFLKLLPGLNVIVSRCADFVVSVFCLLLIFWLLVKFVVKSAGKTLKYGFIYFVSFYFILVGFILSDAIIITKEMVECFLNNMGHYSVDTNLEVFERQRGLRDFILLTSFFLIDTIISSAVVFLLRFLKLFPILTTLPKTK